MKLKIFDCKTKHAKLFRIVVCSFALAFIAVLFCIGACGAVLNGAIEDLINSLGLMMY